MLEERAKSNLVLLAGYDNEPITRMSPNLVKKKYDETTLLHTIGLVKHTTRGDENDTTVFDALFML